MLERMDFFQKEKLIPDPLEELLKSKLLGPVVQAMLWLGNDKLEQEKKKSLI